MHGGSTVSVSGQGFSDASSHSSTHVALRLGGGINMLETDRAGIWIGADYLHFFPKNGETTRVDAF